MYLNIIPRSPDLFYGRDKELKKLEEFFQETNFCYIEGISGVGKTALMLKWADILIKNLEYKDKILWIKCLEDRTLDKLLEEIDDWLAGMGEISIKELAGKPLKNEEKALYIIKQLSKHEYIIFIDDFHNIKEESCRLFIDILKNYIRNSRIYIISQRSLPLGPLDCVDICRIRVKELEQEDALLFLKKIFAFHDIKKIPDKETLLKIIDKTRGHPFMLKIFSGTIIARVSTIDEIICGCNMENDIWKMIFGKMIKNLSPLEKTVLETLSASRISLKPEMIKDITKIENVSQILLLLEGKIFIEKEEMSSYLIHPLLKSYIWNNMSERQKRMFHNILCEYFEKKEEYFRETFYHAIHSDNPENAVEIFAKVMNKLYSQGYYEEILEKLELVEKHMPLSEYMKIMKSKIYFMNGKSDESLLILEELKNKISDENLLGEIYFSLAELYRCRNNISIAIEFYYMGLKIFRGAGNWEQITKIINELIATYHLTGEHEKASEFINESFSIAEKENNQTFMAYALQWKAILFDYGEDYEKSLNAAEEFLTLAKKVESFQLICNALHIKGRILSRMKRYDEACKCFEDNLNSGEKIGYKLLIAKTYRGLSRVFFEKGDLEKALEFIKKSVENFMNVGNKLGTIISEYNMAYILEEKGEIYIALDLYSKLLKEAEELFFKKVEIGASIQIVKNRLKFNGLNNPLEDILKLKKKTPDYLIRERIEINILLADIYIRKYKQKKKEILLNEALDLSEKIQNKYCLAKTCYMIGKISNRNKNEKEMIKKRAEEYIEKITIMYEKRELKRFFEEIDRKTKDMYFVKTSEKEKFVDPFELEKVRNMKKEYEFFIDVPGKYAFEKDKSEIDIFRRTKLLPLLLFFIHNKDEAFSIEDIHKEIWEWEYEGERSDIEVRKSISRLRKLIEPDEKNLKYILIREGSLGEKTKYYFNPEANFCLINFLY